MIFIPHATSLHGEKYTHPTRCAPLSSLPSMEKRGVPPLFLVAQKKKENKASKSWTPHIPYTLSLFFSSFREEILRDFLANFWPLKKGSFAGFTVENWKRKVLPNERNRRKKMGLLFCAQPWRRSSSFKFFFYFILR